MSSKELYNILVQGCIDHYLNYKIEKSKELDIFIILDHFSKVRNIIANIMYKVNNCLNESTFCKKEELSEFGKWRNLNDPPSLKDLIITPFYGKYNKIVDMCRYLSNDNKFEIDSSIQSPNITLIKKMYKSDPSIKVIKHSNINGNLSILYYENDDDLIKSIENIYPASEHIEENSLLYRCVFHTESYLHLNLLDIIKNMIKDVELRKGKLMEVELEDYMFKIFWFMCQASFFYRGSASISEMAVTVIYNVFRNNGKFYIPVFTYGSDVHAIVNNIEDFKKMAYGLIKLDNIKKCTETKQKDAYDFSLEDLEVFSEKISYKSKSEIREILYKIVYEKRNLTYATIIYKQELIEESDNLIDSLFKELA